MSKGRNSEQCVEWLPESCSSIPESSNQPPHACRQVGYFTNPKWVTHCFSFPVLFHP
jgi:hypothetical protein